MPEKTYAAPALEKGIEVVELLARSGESMSMVEIASRLDLSKHQIYRVLISLERFGWLVKEPGEQFALTNRLFDLAMKTPPQRNLLLASLPLMRELTNRTRQSCHLAVASGDDMVVVARVESPGMLGFAVRVGYRLPLGGSTSGAVLSAFAGENVKPATGKQRSSKEFKLNVATAREQGYLTKPSSFVEGIIDISAPIKGVGETAIAALTMPFLSGPLTDETVESASQAIVETAEAITDKLRLG